MLKVNDIHKTFSGKSVLSGVSFEAHEGEVIGLLGLNGAGKTTLMRIMTGYLAPDAGTICLNGVDLSKNPVRFKENVGYLPEQAPAYAEMRVLEFLNFMAEARGVSSSERSAAVAKAVQMCHLEAVENALAGKLSKGYRHRLGLAQAIVNNPALLILDEPTDGLDPQQKIEARELIAELGKQRIVIVSTHIMEEVKTMCSRTVILEDGAVAEHPAFHWNI